MLEGTVRVGGRVSTTFTKNEPVVVSDPRVAVQSTCVMPSGKFDPEAGLHATVASGSVVAAKVTVVPFGAVASATMSLGTVRKGGGRTLTKTENVPTALFACESSAEQRTLVSPLLNVDPDSGEQVTGIEPSMLSTAVAVQVTTAESLVTSEGSVSTGATVSVTKTLNEPVVVPNASLTEQFTCVVPRGKLVPES